MLTFAGILYAIGFALQGLGCVFYDLSWARHVFWFGLILSFWGFFGVVSEIFDIKKEITKLNKGD